MTGFALWDSFVDLSRANFWMPPIAKIARFAGSNQFVHEQPSTFQLKVRYEIGTLEDKKSFEIF